MLREAAAITLTASKLLQSSSFRGLDTQDLSIYSQTTVVSMSTDSKTLREKNSTGFSSDGDIRGKETLQREPESNSVTRRTTGLYRDQHDSDLELSTI